MPTLYEQTLVELKARLETIPGLGTAGVMRGDSFAPEREQWPAIDIADGTLTIEHQRNNCEWRVRADPQVRITAGSESERDTLLDLAIGELAGAWAVPDLAVMPVSIVLRRGGSDKTAFVVVIACTVGPFTTVAYNLSQSPS